MKFFHNAKLHFFHFSINESQHYFILLQVNKKQYVMKRILNCVAAGLVFLFFAEAEAQTIVTVTMQDASTQVFNVTASGKLFFENDQLVVIEAFSQSAAIDIADIRKVQFQSNDEDAVPSINKDKITIYPNPTTGKIKISGLDGVAVDVSVYSANGQLVMKRKITSDEEIDLSDMKRGLYMLKINDSVYKISKI